ncbi:MULTISPECIES: polysaccharide deacetylase family protein [unclassified Burkholderia]|uniref:polysaccharide deacetylase family protein n=1 Tax=unclassified Burkholderia TaxID=2613784 RepID=UPI000F564225|nr:MULTISPECIES: polysaccharide deacetylase family protein [unclassified Burkholderia]RQR74973.1 polysaccharide deacetylase [Burkholderia sp. Bp9011]RQR86084.1 polysaccharide deacetylase [Burkholderia sp. Bp9010]RQS00667.1 polysaccharide deacetylase [Burkholderia sp. Bp8991]RQS67387.1 polysaccharide deacetylase [Burkholderia sp. Bp8977]
MTDSDYDSSAMRPARRKFLAQAGAGAAAGIAMATGASRSATAAPISDAAGTNASGFWPDNTRLAISISMQFEAGGQPSKGADSPFPPIEFPPSVPVDLASATWFAYGYREGIPRLLDLWDRHGVKVTSHMIGEAVRRHPELAREIVSRGHEAAAHGPTWRSQFAMSRDDERRFLTEARDMVEAATGRRPIGYNCNWLRRGPHTLPLLQELGYVYHIDDVSRDEPFIETVDGRDFAVVPYTLRNNDILLIEGRNYSPTMFLEQIKLDFDQLYAEAGQRRRLMSISAHDRISGTPQMVRAWDAFLHYARSHPGVAFMRKDDIARFALRSPSTLREAETI